MPILIIAEHDNHTINPATLNTVTAASQLGDDITLLVAGAQCANVSTAASKIAGVTRVLTADDDAYSHQLAENVAPLVADIGKDYDYILAPATTTGKNLLPRVAAMLDVAPMNDIVAIASADTFQRPIYAGSALATVQSSDAIKVISVRASAFAAAAAEGGAATVDTVDKIFTSELSRFVSDQLAAGDRPELTAARVVVSGGRGLGSAEQFHLLDALADKLDAAIGASRAAVDADFVANDKQVGQTGKVVAPELYVAVGISGAVQHLAGMKDSKVIVAINNDPDAPIFQVADYGLVADCFEVLPALVDML